MNDKQGERASERLGAEVAHNWRVRFQMPDGYYTFTDIGSTSGLPMSKAATLAWGANEVCKNPYRYSNVASVYSIDHEVGT